MRNFKVTIEGKSYDVGVEEVLNGNSVAPVITKMAESKPVAVSAPAQTAPVSAPVANAQGFQLKAPMPGMILNFKVENGATVKKGQVIIILEAMKMENDISAPCDGIINFVVAKGATVATGAVMAVIG